MTDATRIRISYPADLSSWGRRQLETPWVRGYLRRTLGSPDVGAVREEFLDVGCCGDSLTVPLRVEALEDGTHVGSSTSIEYEVREACGLAGGWRVQSAGGPTE